MAEKLHQKSCDTSVERVTKGQESKACTVRQFSKCQNKLGWAGCAPYTYKHVRTTLDTFTKFLPMKFASFLKESPI